GAAVLGRAVAGGIYGGAGGREGFGGPGGGDGGDEFAGVEAPGAEVAGVSVDGAGAARGGVVVAGAGDDGVVDPGAVGRVADAETAGFGMSAINASSSDVVAAAHGSLVARVMRVAARHRKCAVTGGAGRVVWMIVGPLLAVLLLQVAV